MKTLTKEEQKKREDLYRFAWSKLDQYDLRDKGWSVTILPSIMRRMKKNILGYCSFNRKEIVISLDYLLANDNYELEQTVLHEIAHALVGQPHRHNNRVFKDRCNDVGLQPHKNINNPFPTRQAKEYTGTCPVCGTEYNYNRRMRISCGKCSKVYDDKYKIIWR